MTDLKTIIADLVAEEKIQIACDLLGKEPKSYAHLDRGRKAMTGGNLLRLAVAKKPELMDAIKAATATIIAARPSDFNRESQEKSGGLQHDPASDLSFPEYFPEEDIAKWERQAEESEAGPKPILWGVMTKESTTMYYGKPYPVMQVMHRERDQNHHSISGMIPNKTK